MKRYIFDKSIDRKSTYSVRWNVKEGDLPLNIADMDFEVFPEIKAAVIKRSELDCYGYIDTPKEYFDAYVHWWKERHDLDLKREWFLFSSSVVGSIDCVLKNLFSRGDKVSMFTPIYNVFYNCIRNNELVLEESELIYKNGSYYIDWDNLDKMFANKSIKAFIFCNPHNPVGRGFSLEEINRLINLCKHHNVLLISDEIHCDIDYNQSKYTSVFHSELSNYGNIILLLSPTKIFNIAGLQTSTVVIKNKALREKVQNALYKDDIGEPNYFAVDPVIAAFNHGQQYVYELNAYLKENYEYLHNFFDKFLQNLNIISLSYTYLAWIDISFYGIKSEEFVNSLKEKTGLILAPGRSYGKISDSFVRFNIATPRKNIVDACNRLLMFIKELEREKR